MRVSFFVSVLFFCAATAGASVAEQLFDQLKTELKAEALAAREKGDDRSQQQFYRLQEILMQVQRSPSPEEGDGNLQQSIEALGSFTASDKIEGICKALAAELKTAQEKREASLTAEMEKTFAESLRTALAAKSAKDVDGALGAVSKLGRDNSNRSTRNPKLRALINEGQQLSEFLRQWQDYLAATESGNVTDARGKLQNLVGQGRDFSSFMPRSELLARMNALQNAASPAQRGNPRASQAEQLKAAREIVTSIEKLDDIAGAVAKIDEFQGDPSAGLSPSLSTLITQLRSVGVNYSDIKRGLASRMSMAQLTSNYGSDQTDVLGPLRQMLLLFAIPRVLGLDESIAAQPEENVMTFLQRLLTAAKTREDWVVVGRILDLAQQLNFGAVASSGDTRALQSFLAGLNQERAGQYSLAVISYQAALKSGSQVIAPELIGAHLATIKKTSPEEFERGMQFTLNPPPIAPDERDPRFPGRSYPPGYSSPGRPVATPSPVLDVPAKPTPPTATPAPTAK